MLKLWNIEYKSGFANTGIVAWIKGNYNKDLVDTFMDVLGDGKCTKKEWTEIGEKLGVFTEG